jgi:hypothetical protein
MLIQVVRMLWFVDGDRLFSLWVSGRTGMSNCAC